MSPENEKFAPVWISDDGWVTNLRIVHPAPLPRRTKPRPRLTPEQRGRFWQSVANTSAAAKADTGEEGRT